MAEVLGAAASATGLATLVVQLGQGLFKLKQLHEKLKDAPKSLQQIMQGICALELCLQHMQSYGCRPISKVKECALVDAALEVCSNSVHNINTLIDELAVSFTKSKTRGRLHVVLKDGALRYLLEQLGREQTLLMLAIQAYTEGQRQAEQDLMSSKLQQLILAVAQAPRGPTISREVPFNQVLAADSESATLSTVEPTTHVECHRQYGKYRGATNSRIVLAIVFRPWFLERTWSLVATQSMAGFKVQLQVYNDQSLHGELFRRCQKGDLMAVKRLIANGRGSPLDRDPTWGTTLLNVSDHMLNRSVRS
jgi:hypothetical protein